MFAIFERDKAKFADAICTFREPQCIISGHFAFLAPLFLLTHSASFRVVSNRICQEFCLKEGGSDVLLKFLRADEYEEEEDWEGLDADFEGMGESCRLEDTERHWWASLLCDVSEWHFSVD